MVTGTFRSRMSGTVLVGTTIKENISYGKGATMEEIEDASTFTNAVKFITRVSQGYDTLFGELGIQLFGGQTQRFAIARAILKNHPILLLHEATSALDAESEVVQEALLTGCCATVRLVVAHRLCTITNADMIAVVQRGAIVGTGVGVLIATPVQQWSFAVVGNKLIRRIRRPTFEKILQQEINYFDQDENSSGAIGSRL